MKHNFNPFLQYPPAVLAFLSTYNLTMIPINQVDKEFYGQLNSMLLLIYQFAQLSCKTNFEDLFNTKIIDLLNCLKIKALL